MTEPKKAHICVLPHAGGWHNGAWRRPHSNGHDTWNWDLWKDVAQTAERGLLDAIFVADQVSLWPFDESLRHHTAKVGQWEAFTLLSAMATVTERIGLVATAHTQFNEPYNIARRIACLDLLSKGRAGWNIVTGGNIEAARNFGYDAQVDREDRYDQAWEFVEVVKGLLDSWEDDAYLWDKGTAEYYDPSKLHVLNHSGRYYKVAGPLNVMRPPQGYPLLAQAGASGPGKRLAAGVGELIFTPHSGPDGQAFYREVKALATEMGRTPDDLKILSQITPVVAKTDGEAEDKWAELQSLLDPALARATIGQILDLDLTDHPLDEPLPEPEQENFQRTTGYRDVLLSQIRGENPTLRDLIFKYRGPGTVVGSAESVADHIESELDQGACDGFVVLLQGCPEELHDFVDLVVPELQRRRRFRTTYEGSTLRDLIGVARPANQFVRQRNTPRHSVDDAADVGRSRDAHASTGIQ